MDDKLPELTLLTVDLLQAPVIGVPLEARSVLCEFEENGPFFPLLRGNESFDVCPPELMREVVWRRFGSSYTEEILRFRYLGQVACLVHTRDTRWANKEIETFYVNPLVYPQVMQVLLARTIRYPQEQQVVIPAVPVSFVYSQFLDEKKS
jgi:hypothetical protein